MDELLYSNTGNMYCILCTLYKLYKLVIFLFALTPVRCWCDIVISKNGKAWKLKYYKVNQYKSIYEFPTEKNIWKMREKNSILRESAIVSRYIELFSTLDWKVFWLMSSGNGVLITWNAYTYFFINNNAAKIKIKLFREVERTKWQSMHTVKRYKN